ncbi:MAG: transposase family protein, partial [Dehalococcoidia bacterium]
MRDTTVLRRLLAIPEIRVVGVELGPEGLIVDVRLRRGIRLRCPSCAFTTRAVYDRRPERLWRHLDGGGRRCWLRMPLRRLACPEHGVL